MVDFIHNNKDRYGVEHQAHIKEVREKTKQTNLERHGATTPAGSKEVVEKIKSTNMERYGVTCTRQHEEVEQKSKTTMLERYGVEHYTQSDEFKKYCREQNLESYGRFCHMQKHFSDETFERLNDPSWLKDAYETYGVMIVSDILEVDSTIIYDRLQKYNIELVNDNKSFMEKDVNRFVESLGFETEQSDRSLLGGKELDIIIPEKKIAIEFNGLYWHSSKFVRSNYHLDKTRQMEDAGYQLIHIFEDEWKHRNDQIRDKLKSILGVDDREKIHARKTEIVKITDTKRISKFYDDHHIQGSARQTLTTALTSNDEIVAMVSFVKRTDNEYELNRYATSKRVIGGMSKLMKHAKMELVDLGVTRIVSFADKRYSMGNMYEKTGWVHEYDTQPDYQYVVNDHRVRKQKFRHKRMAKVLEEYDPNLSELHNTEKHGIYRIYDCGLKKYSMEL
jgi:G:T-mismatch repair DNA endonuclease (very short patch repair protein)